MKSIKELHNIHCGKDIYVIGSGSSLDFLDKSFFAGKLCIGVNHVPKYYTCTYGITHHPECIKSLIESGTEIVASQYRHCMSGVFMYKYIPVEHYYYKHIPRKGDNLDFSCIDNPYYLVTGTTTIIDAMSFAYHVGGKNIILCGADGVLINGRNNFKGYYPEQGDGLFVEQKHRINPVKHTMDRRKLIESFAAFLRTKKVNVLSINPFVNMNFEGNKIHDNG